MQAVTFWMAIGVGMTISDDAAVPAARHAASVVLLRDGPQGLEVLLLRRHQASAVMGGVYVFPGGKLDAADAAPSWAAQLDQPAPTLWRRLGEPDASESLAQGLFVAALRETFEEAGVLLATAANGRSVPADVLPALQRALADGQGWGGALAERGLKAGVQALQPWTRWITPVQPVLGRQRFDTRFFLAALPVGQSVVVDDREVTEACWLTPMAALERYRDRQMDMIAPQLMGLAQLHRYGDVATALAEAASRPPPCILPATFAQGDARVMCYPGDAEHPLPGRAMDGPLRLRYSAGRFEPFNGFDGWFE